MEKKVLIIDDTAFMRVIIRDLLLRNIPIDHIYEGATGLEAVHLYKLLKPDLVIMDITMPEMDGLTALKEIKKYDGDANVIMLSSRSHKPLVVESIQAGAVDFIVKPFQESHVIDTVNKHLFMVQHK